MGLDGIAGSCSSPMKPSVGGERAPAVGAEPAHSQLHAELEAKDLLIPLTALPLPAERGLLRVGCSPARIPIGKEMPELGSAQAGPAALHSTALPPPPSPT